VLLLAPDAYVAFGLVFLVLAAALVFAGGWRRLMLPAGRSRVRTAPAHT
jgi:hypothetical protein